jgi:hypothetical protein
MSNAMYFKAAVRMPHTSNGRRRRYSAALGGFLITIVLAACGGGGGDDGGGATTGGTATGSTTAPPAPTQPSQPTPTPATTRPLNLALKQGDFMEFFWLSERTDFTQGKGNDATVDVGRFKLALGASVLIQGQAAFPLTLTGDSGEFAPRWTHIAVGPNGSLLGSTNGAGLATIYDAASDTWTGGGMFVDFAQNPMKVSVGRFKGAYNDVPAIVAGRSVDDPRCQQLFGLDFCEDEGTQFAEQEFYKEGVGPIGYALHFVHADQGSNFTTATTINKTVELIESTLTATDGSVFKRPPWDEMAPMNTPRRRHAAVVTTRITNQIWVLGGVDANNNLLSSTEIYNPVTNTWSPGPALPVPMADFAAVVIGTTTYVPPRYDAQDQFKDDVLYYPTPGGWGNRRPTSAAPAIRMWDATYHNDTHFQFGEILVGSSRVTSLSQPSIHFNAYDPKGNQALFGGPPQSWSELMRFTVEAVGDTMLVIGGFGRSGSGGPFDGSGALDTIMKYDLKTDRWLTTGVGAMNRAREHHASVVLNNRVYIFGGNAVACNAVGTCRTENPYREAEVYDPATGDSTDLPPMFQPRKNFAAVSVNGLIYIIGGSDGEKTFASVERLTPP